MTTENYYKAPPQNIFDEIKENAIKIWQGYDDTYGYATEKIDSIKNIKNVSDNAWHMVAMFDYVNQGKLLSLCSEETKEMILDAMNS